MPLYTSLVVGAISFLVITIMGSEAANILAEAEVIGHVLSLSRYVHVHCSRPNHMYLPVDICEQFQPGL